MNRIIAALFLGALVTPAVAQGPASPAPVPAGKTIAMDQALAAAQASIEACAAKKSPVTVQIVDLNGLTKVLLSADGAATNSFDYASKKAYTVMKKKMSSGDFGKSVTVVRGQPIEGDAMLIQYGGGEPIKRNGEVIGAIAVSGPTGPVDDDACAMAGVAKIH